MSRNAHRRRRRLSAPRPVCRYGCGARLIEVQLGQGVTALVERDRAVPATPGGPPAKWAVRRTGSDTGVARPLVARPLEPNEHPHHDHDDVCPRRASWAARQGAAAAEGVPDVTRPRRTDT